MLSKEMVVSLPFVVCLYEYYFLRDDQAGRWKLIVPLFLVTLLIPWLAIHSLDFSKLPRLAQDNSGVPAGQYFLTQLRVKVTYLRLFFVPVHQSFAYDFTLAKSIFEVPILLSTLLLTVVLGAGVMLKNRSPLMSFGILWFLITIFPESSFIPTNNAACEYRLYLPMVGFSLFLSGGVFQLFKQRNVNWAIGLLSMLVLVYSILTYHRNKVWENEFTLWDDAVHKDPQSRRAHLNRGAAYQKQGDLDHALQDYNAVIGLGLPDFVTLSNRGAIFEQRGELDLALANFNAAVKMDPGYPGSYKNRGKAYFRKGDLVDALKDFNTYIAMSPSDYDGYISRGAVYANTGHLDQALSDFNNAASLQPGDPEIENDRAIVLEELQKK
jgi:Tfp pilus assembly protein PilF